jgi:8-oxo-dGTP diphosphatase
MVDTLTVYKLPQVLRSLTDEQNANAAVALLLRHNPELDDYQILIVKRAKNPRDPWSGQFALPGGKREAQDANLKATVTRETREETGIDLNQSSFLGTTTVIQSTPRPDYRILPCVIQLTDQTKITLRKEELEAYFWVSIENLKAAQGTAQIGTRLVSAFLLPNAIVWGITHHILTDFLNALQQVS